MFLLNGDVCPKLGSFRSQLLSTPTSMTKTWSKIVPRTEALFNRLKSLQVNTKDKLLDVWKINPSCKYCTIVFYNLGILFQIK